MADLNEQTWKFAQRAEKEFQVTLGEKGPTFRDIDFQLAQYRTKCENLILQDFEFALSKDVENRLWNAHGKVNNRFRKQLSTFRQGSGKKKLVEHRKAVKHYLDFIKSSQRFYRGYIQKLDSLFDGIPELRAVAGKLNLDALHIDSHLQAPQYLRHAVLMSCHQTLVRLGDLSRYRESELASKEYNWGPATGYYVLAGTLYPASGASHNQLAVIARTDTNHLRATYHLYRALAVEEPHPAARGNLEIEFKKIHEAWDKGELVANGLQHDGQGPGKALVGWFMRLHARCYNGIDFVEHDELENEVLSQLAVDLKERSLEGTLNKFVLINLAAEYFAGQRFQENPESEETKQSFLFFLRLNIRTFFTLLQILQPELEPFTGTEGIIGADGLASNRSDKITAVARRVLPGLRHYSSWFTTRAKLLVIGVGESSLTVQTKELWKTYANTLTLLASTFPAQDLPAIDYLLDEDEDTLGFKPTENENTTSRYYDDESGTRKPKYHDCGIERHHPNIEMLGRIRDLLRDGLKLQLEEDIPIKLVSGTTMFAYHGDGLTEFIGSPEGHQATVSSASVEREDIPRPDGTIIRDAVSAIGESPSEAASVSVSTNTHRWVDNLVGSEIADNNASKESLHNSCADRPPPTTPAYSFEDSPVKDAGNDTSYGLIGTSTARDFVRDLRSDSPQTQLQSTPRPTLPSILNSPFAPQAGEESPHSRAGTTKRMTTHSPRNSQNVFSMQQQPIGYSIGSSVSIIQDPSQQTQNRDFGVIAPPLALHARRVLPLLDESEFHSPSIFHGSSWEGPRPSGIQAMSVLTPTPPNGQGGG